jgi:hypothetical protein
MCSQSSMDLGFLGAVLMFLHELTTNFWKLPVVIEWPTIATEEPFLHQGLGAGEEGRYPLHQEIRYTREIPFLVRPVMTPNGPCRHGAKKPCRPRT